jgi:uncharacterized protein (DUF433 family)
MGWQLRRSALVTTDRLRFETPLYSLAEAARIVAVPARTLHDWARGYVRRFPDRQDVTGGPVITYFPPARQGEPGVPFVGLAEALVLAAIRRSGVPMQRIRPALAELEREIGLEHALATRKLYADGAELLFDYGEQHDDADARSVRDLVVVRNRQRVFVDVIREYLQAIRYGDDGYPELIKVPAYSEADVVVDPRRAFGAPVFSRGGARVDDVLERFWAGESIYDLSAEFGVPAVQLEDVLRVASRRAA